MYEAPPPYPGIDPNLIPYYNPGAAAAGGQSNGAHAPPFTSSAYPPGSAAGL